MNESFKKWEIMDDNEVLVCSYSANTRLEVDVMAKVNAELKWCSGKVTAAKFDYMPRSNYFGVEFRFEDTNGEKVLIKSYTSDMENVYIGKVIEKIESL